MVAPLRGISALTPFFALCGGKRKRRFGDRHPTPPSGEDIRKALLVSGRAFQ